MIPTLFLIDRKYVVWGYHRKAEFKVDICSLYFLNTNFSVTQINLCNGNIRKTSLIAWLSEMQIHMLITCIRLHHIKWIINVLIAIDDCVYTKEEKTKTARNLITETDRWWIMFNRYILLWLMTNVNETIVQRTMNKRKISMHLLFFVFTRIAIFACLKLLIQNLLVFCIT